MSEEHEEALALYEAGVEKLNPKYLNLRNQELPVFLDDIRQVFETLVQHLEHSTTVPADRRQTLEYEAFYILFGVSLFEDYLRSNSFANNIVKKEKDFKVSLEKKYIETLTETIKASLLPRSEAAMAFLVSTLFLYNNDFEIVC